MKQCVGCWRWKELDMFHVDSKAKDGRKNHCKVCRKIPPKKRQWSSKRRMPPGETKEMHVRVPTLMAQELIEMSEREGYAVSVLVSAAVARFLKARST